MASSGMASSGMASSGKSRAVATSPTGEVSLGAAGARVLVVEARFYDALADELLAGAREALARAGCDIDVITVPGALEIPATVVIALRAAGENADPYEAVVALGCVIRGETGHYDIVAGESARALMDISVAYEMPLGNGILTVENEAQAHARANRHEMNKGGGAAEAALAVLAIKRRLNAEAMPGAMS